MKNLLLLFLATSLFSSVAIAYENFDCTGSNPSWVLHLSKTNFNLKIENKDKLLMSPVTAQPAVNIPLDHLRIYRTTAKNNPILIIIQNQSCAINNEETVYKYEGLIITPDKIFHGCCNEKLVLTRY